METDPVPRVSGGEQTLLGPVTVSSQPSKKIIKLNPT
jgi:hypothetical protein